jgi:enamine deaminase RidA (YjgF/YER057c/UK114 family)
MPMNQNRPVEPSAPRALQVLLPEGWPRPKGYSNGVAASGRTVFVGGQVGWTPEGEFSEDFLQQVRQALENVVAVLAEAGAGPEHVARLTWYVLDMDEYLGNLNPLGRIYRDVMGLNYPAMSLVQVMRLVEPSAKVEIEATAVLAE